MTYRNRTIIVTKTRLIHQVAVVECSCILYTRGATDLLGNISCTRTTICG